MIIRPNRRELLLGAAAATAAGALAKPALAAGKPDRLVFLCVVGGWGDVLYKQAIPAFEQATGIKVESTLLPADGLQTRLRAELIANSGGVDLAMWNPPWAGWMSPHMADHDALLKEFGTGPDDINWDSDLYKPAVAMASYKGKKLGLPYRVVAHVLYYQRDLLKRLGYDKPPATFDEMLDAARKITADGNGQRFGIGLQGKVGSATVGSFEPFLYSFGGDFYDQNTYQILINNDKAVQALDYYAGLLTKEKVVPPEVTTWQQDEVIAGGQTDRYGMTEVIGPWATQINGNGGSTKGKWATEGKWGFAPLVATSPGGGRSAISGWSVGIPESTPNREWAFRLLQHITNKNWLLKTIEGGNLPPVASLETDANIAANYAWAAATANSLKTAFLEPRDDVWPQLNTRLSVGISEALSAQKSAKQALDDVAADWDKLLRRAKLLKS